MSEPFWTPLGGQPVDYEGEWGPGTQYAPGDVVVYNGLHYLAVNPSLGLTPPAALAVPFMGLSLPSTPFDGMIFTLVDSLTAPTYAWRFQYMAAKASNKWVFIGGSPLMGEVATSFSPGSSYLSDGGPSLAVPVAGYYLIDFGCEVGAYANDFMRMSFAQPPATPQDADSMLITPNVSGVSTVHTGAKAIRKTLTVANLVFYYKAGNVSRSFQQRWAKVTPIAVGG
jgi:hypothetical protein